MLPRILIANRGEIALRILRACKALGFEAVAIYTPIDIGLPYLKLADQTVCVSSYLSMNDIIMAARTSDCVAIHPGYGWLSENADFARKVEEVGIKFVGPTADQIHQLGNKLEARRVLSAAGLQPVPGSSGSLREEADLIARCHDIGFPLVIKAAFGGGGKGIRKVDAPAELLDALATAESEAKTSFGRSEVYVERYFSAARHVEVQIFGDGKGQVVHLGSRDCSVQRRYQKLVEEAPAPAIDPQLLTRLATSCTSAMARLNYRNAGTLEFLYADGEFYFLEVNTRLQVEHPVSELITGIDLVTWQLDQTLNAGFTLNQRDVTFNGAAIECRINAENDAGVPSPGRISKVILPGGPGVRLDTHICTGYVVPYQYDSLLCKLVVFAPTRDQCLSRLRWALEEMEIEGIETNLPLLRRIVSSNDFSSVNIRTAWRLD